MWGKNQNEFNCFSFYRFWMNFPSFVSFFYPHAKNLFNISSMGSCHAKRLKIFLAQQNIIKFLMKKRKPIKPKVIFTEPIFILFFSQCFSIVKSDVKSRIFPPSMWTCVNVLSHCRKRRWTSFSVCQHPFPSCVWKLILSAFMVLSKCFLSISVTFPRGKLQINFLKRFSRKLEAVKRSRNKRFRNTNFKKSLKIVKKLEKSHAKLWFMSQLPLTWFSHSTFWIPLLRGLN